MTVPAAPGIPAYVSRNLAYVSRNLALFMPLSGEKWDMQRRWCA